jgi:hypothetical protein
MDDDGSNKRKLLIDDVIPMVKDLPGQKMGIKYPIVPILPLYSWYRNTHI